VNSNPLFYVSSPLRKAAGRGGVRVLLLDGTRTSRCASQMPLELPESFRGALGERVDLQTPGGRLIVVGCGKPGDAASEDKFWEASGAAAIDALRALRVKSAALSGELRPDSISKERAAEQFALGAILSSYQCIAYRATPPKSYFEVEGLGLAGADWARSSGGRELGAAVNWARALVDAPANVLTP